MAELYAVRWNELAGLLRPRHGPCVSLFLPWPANATGRARLTGLFHQAERLLTEQGERAQTVSALLAPSAQLEGELHATGRPGDGLAVFLTTEALRWYTVPLRLAPMAQVGSGFCLQPLLPLLRDDGRSYVLALGSEDARLLECTRTGTSTVETVTVPAAVRRELRATARVAARPSGGGGGLPRETAPPAAQRFCALLEGRLHAVLSRERVPMVLAGHPRMTSWYRRVNTYPRLDGELTADVDGVDAAGMRRLAWPTLELALQAGRRAAVHRYQEVRGSALGLSGVSHVARAARRGRVEALLLADDGCTWAAGQERLADRPCPETLGPVDAAAVDVLVHDGAVYRVDADELGGDGPVAAVLRY